MATKYDPNVVHVVNCAEVEVDRAWNSRRSIEDVSETPEGGKGFDGLVVSIATEGQKTPVVIRPNPKYGKVTSAKPLALVSGFQRWEAITRIAAGECDAILLDTKAGAGMTQVNVDKMHTKEPNIRAFINVMSDWEARKENLGENMQRNSLSVPDIAFGVADLRRLNPDLTDQAVANVLSKSQGYVSQLKRITETVKGKLLPGDLDKSSKGMSILDAWRLQKINKIGAKEMELIGKVPTEDQRALYKLKAGLKEAGGTGTDTGLTRGQGGWAQNAAVNAAAFGTMIGELARRGALVVSDAFFDFENVVMLISPVRPASKKPIGEEDQNRVSAACEDAYTAARSRKVDAVVPAGTVDPKATAAGAAHVAAAAANGTVAAGDKKAPKKGAIATA